MSSHPNLFALEGPDGCGKATQSKMLVERLIKEGFKAQKISFPRYETSTGRLVKKYLDGALGPANEIDPFVASVFYARDREAAIPEINQLLEEGKVVIFDRYVASNLAHQGGKIKDPELRKQLISKLLELEFKLLDIPSPRLTIILNVPVEISYQLILERAEKENRPPDGHENENHLQAAFEVYQWLPKRHFDWYKIIECCENGKLLSSEIIHEKVWSLIKPLLPPLM